MMHNQKKGQAKRKYQKNGETRSRKRKTLRGFLWSHNFKILPLIHSQNLIKSTDSARCGGPDEKVPPAPGTYQIAGFFEFRPLSSWKMGNILLIDWVGEPGRKYLARERGQDVRTESPIFSHKVRPNYSVNKHFIIWPLSWSWKVWKFWLNPIGRDYITDSHMYMRNFKKDSTIETWH